MIDLSSWCEQPISRQHRRESFDCGQADLNTHLRRHARQNHQRGGAKTFVAVPSAKSTKILGYYTISPASIAFARVPEVLSRGLGRYEVPAFRLARLAVDLECQGQGLGAELLLAAGRRALAVSQEVGGVALLIEAKDDGAASWYARFGALRLRDDPRHLVLPLATIARALRAAQRSK